MTEQASLQRPLFRHWLGLLLLALLLASLLWPLKQLAEHYYQERLNRQSNQTLALFAANLQGILSRYEVLPQIMSELPELRLLLEQPDNDQARQAANLLLERVHQRTSADVIYLMDLQGGVLASSNWQQPDSFVHANFNFRPYFQQALEQGSGRFFGQGTVSDERGYYFAQALNRNDQPLGVLAVKVDLNQTESLWGRTPEQLLVTDSLGVVILTSRDEWRFRATRSLSSQEQQDIRDHQLYPTNSPETLALNPYTWIVNQWALDQIGWELNLLAPRYLIQYQVNKLVAIAAISLVVLMLLLGLALQRRHQQRLHQLLEKRARQELERRVEERTSELVKAQDKLVQAGKLSALAVMSASVSHELNQPLAAVRTFADNAQILLQQGRNDAVQTNLEKITRLTERMASIIAHLKAFIRRTEPASERVLLQAAVDDSLNLLASRLQQLEIELLRELPETPLWVQASETRLRQLLNNLLSNALDALAGQTAPRSLQLQVNQQDNWLCLHLRDNGPGFTEEALQQAKEPFYTTKASTEGMGLGLAICDVLAQGMNGELELGNHPQGGAWITLRLRPLPDITPIAPTTGKSRHDT